MSVLLQVDELLLKIYSIDYLLKCRVDEASEDTVKLSPLSGKVDMFQLHDPVVMLFEYNKFLHTLPADVAFIDKSRGQVVFARPARDVEEERRIFERYPVSLTVSARRKFSSKRLHLVAKNISMYGMGVISRSELDIDEYIDIDLITDRNMFYFSGKVVWKELLGEDFEYGLQLTHFDVATKSTFEDYLEKQKAEYIKQFPRAR
jgi:hypothetical protein